jgi:hypothetical protein
MCNVERNGFLLWCELVSGEKSENVVIVEKYVLCMIVYFLIYMASVKCESYFT